MFNRKDNKLDEIDAELSRTYFSHISKESFAQDKDSDLHPKRKTSKKRLVPRFVKISLAVIIPVAVLTFLIVYFLKSTKIEFNVNINVATDKTPSLAPNKASHADTTSTSVWGNREYTDWMTIYTFEHDAEGWEIPEWASEKRDHVAKSLSKTLDGLSSNGTGSLKLEARFPGSGWTAALIEVQQYLNLDGFDAIAADIYLPAKAPDNLRGKFILTVGDGWKFVEMSKNTKLLPGEWTRVVANISEKSPDWKRIVVDDTFKTDIRKVAIRIESNKSSYSGPIYIDNVQAGKLSE